MNQHSRQESYTDIDIYGRGFDGVFGPGAEKASRRSALLKMKEIQDARSAGRAGSYIDYDLYGRGDPRVFGHKAHIANAAQAEEKMPHTKARRKNKKSLRAILLPSKEKLSKFIHKFSKRLSKGKENEGLPDQVSSTSTSENIEVRAQHAPSANAPVPEHTSRPEVEVLVETAATADGTKASEPLEEAPNSVKESTSVARAIKAFNSDGPEEPSPPAVIHVTRAIPISASRIESQRALTVDSQASSPQASDIDNSDSSSRDEEENPHLADPTIVQISHNLDTLVIRSIESESTNSPLGSSQHQATSGSGSSSAKVTESNSSSNSLGTSSSTTEVSNSLSVPNSDNTETPESSSRTQDVSTSESETSSSSTASFRQSVVVTQGREEANPPEEELEGQRSSSQQSSRSSSSTHRVQIEFTKEEVIHQSLSTREGTERSTSSSERSSDLNPKSTSDIVPGEQGSGSSSKSAADNVNRAELEVSDDRDLPGAVDISQRSSSDKIQVESSNREAADRGSNTQEPSAEIQIDAADKSVSENEGKQTSDHDPSQSSESSSDSKSKTTDAVSGTESGNSEQSHKSLEALEISTGEVAESKGHDMPRQESETKEVNGNTDVVRKDSENDSKTHEGVTESHGQAEADIGTRGNSTLVQESNLTADAAKLHSHSNGGDQFTAELSDQADSSEEDEEFVDAIDSAGDSDNSAAVTHSTEVMSSSVQNSDEMSSSSYSSKSSSTLHGSSRYSQQGASTEVEDDSDSDAILAAST